MTKRIAPSHLQAVQHALGLFAVDPLAADPENPTTVFCVLGPNGCGKTTLVGDLRRCSGIVLTTSEELRAAADSGHPDAETIRRHMDVEKTRVPCEIAYEVMMRKLQPMLLGGEHAGRLFALDGLGRTPFQIDHVTAHLHWLRDAGLAIHEGYVFLHLPYDEVEMRVNDRVARALSKGEPPRPEDADGEWQKRFEDYQKLEDQLLETANCHAGRVLRYNLAEASTARVAAELLGMVNKVDADDLHEIIRQKRLAAGIMIA